MEHTTTPIDDPPLGERAREGLEHLQAAARELIEAARALLDVAEELVNDPEAVASVVGTFGALGELVRQRGGTVPGRGPREADGPAAGAHPGVEHIPVG